MKQAASAQESPFKPGDKVEYKRSRYDKNWEVGTVVRFTPSGKQVIVREKPNAFFKDGFERAYALDEIRPVTAPPRPAQATPVNTGRPSATPPLKPGGLLTQEEILRFLQDRLGDQPFQRSDREAVCQELGELIKARGVNFRFENLSDFSNQLGKYGASSEVRFPLMDNFGPPTRQAFLLGTWSMDVIGSTVTVTRGDTVYRQGERGAKGGTLTIAPNGTYVWQLYKSDPPSRHVHGRWRKATSTEMRYQGGDGIVLLGGKGGWDWIVAQDRTAPRGEWVRVSEVVSRQVREFGARVTKR